MGGEAGTGGADWRMERQACGEGRQRREGLGDEREGGRETLNGILDSCRSNMRNAMSM